VSFEVQPGEIVGVIGHNGAGKSTLLKLLSRITHPTTGEIHFRGRVGSLLEVGTGFHPELTGGENVYLSGAILGMTRREIDARFDEIVAFAEIEPFVDTPVKRFSTGMYMRLAFAVAAHLDTDILLVDEVLAVGDARFQQRCLGALQDAAFERGRTVFLVSHNMATIEKLCHRALLIDRGRLVMDGRPAHAVERYLSNIPTVSQPGAWIDLTGQRRSGSGEARFTRMRYRSLDGDARPGPGSKLAIDVDIEASEALTANHLELTITDRRGTRLAHADVSQTGEYVRLVSGRNLYRFELGPLHLNPGRYAFELRLARRPRSPIDHLDPAIEFDIHRPAGIDDAPIPDDAGLLWTPSSIRRLR
jgi:ABC-type polysaccharide/polyol phosphate transport system ATPase subunit